jgi:RimJ/RimL family protein N-acetyltransferase
VDYPERIQTPGLLLRRWRRDDGDALATIWSDPAVWESLSEGGHPDPHQAATTGLDRYLHHWERHGFGLWAAVPRPQESEPHAEATDRGDQPQPVGWIGAWYPDFVPDLAGEIEIGWTLRRPYWGRGLATEGARAAVASAFEHLRPPRVISLIASENERSRAVATRLGMHFAGDTTTDRGSVLGVYSLART